MDDLLSRGFWSKHNLSVSKYRKKLEKRLTSEKKQYDAYLKLTLQQQFKLDKFLGIRGEGSKNFVLKFCLLKFLEKNRNAVRILFKSDTNAVLILKLAKVLKTKKGEKIFDSIKYYSKWVERGSDRSYKILNFDAKLINNLIKNKGLFRKMPVGKNRNLFSYKKLFSGYFGDYYLHIVSKETMGENAFEPIKGFAINMQTGKLEITADVDIEFNAILKTLEKKGIYTEHSDLKGKNSTKVINWLSGNLPTNDFALTEITFNETQLGNAAKLKVTNKKGKDDLSPEIKQLSQRNVIKLTDLHQVSDFGFYHKKARTWIWVVSSYGAYQLKHFNRKVSVQKRRDTETDFEQMFNIPLNEFIEINSTDNEKKGLIKEFLENSIKTRFYGRDKLSKKAEKVYISLVELGLLKKPIKKELKKTCITKGCNYYQKPLWGYKKCPDDGCKKPLLIVGTDYIFEKNIPGILNYIIKKAVEKGYSAEQITRKIQRKPYDFIEIVDKNKDSFLIYVSQGKKIDKKLLDKLEIRYPRLFVVHFEFPIKEVELQDRNFYNMGLLEFIWNYNFIEQTSRRDIYCEALLNQKEAWKQKIIDQSSKAKNNLTQIPAGYDYEQFEFDCFAIINRMSKNAVWLGSKKRGESIPDGAAYLNSKKGMCFAWDCKYSAGKAKRGFNGKTEGHTKFSKYIAELKQNKTIKSLGGLKGFLIIANNANTKNFNKVFKVVKKNSRGVAISLLTKDALVDIFTIYLQNEVNINADPSGTLKLNEWLTTVLFGKSKVRIVTKESVAKNKSKLQLTPLALATVESIPNSPPVS